MKNIIILLAMLTLFPVVTEGNTKTHVSIREKAHHLLKGHQIISDKIIETNSKDIQISRFSFNTDGKWPYGAIYIFWNKKDSQPIWSLVWKEDFQPHGFHFVDFNMDGQSDLFFFAGFEDVSNTLLYLRTKPKSEYSIDNYKLAYRNSNEYTVVLDIDMDGKPEIIDSGEKYKYRDGFCKNGGNWDLEFPDKVKVEIKNKYFQLSSKFEEINFTYNMPNQYPISSMKIQNKVRIFSIIDNKKLNVTTKYKEHLNWRLAMLEQISKQNNEDCKKVLLPTIKYLSEQLEN